MAGSPVILAAIGADYTSFDDVLASLGTLEHIFLRERDRRGAFVTTYVIMTGELKRRVHSGEFHDPTWVSDYAVTFANLYRAALHAYESGARAELPGSWRLAFDAAGLGDDLVIQDLFLGLNAHINRDLPVALTRVGIDPDRSRRYEDHTAVNAVLKASTNTVQTRLARLYDLALGLVDAALGPFDEAVTAFSFVAARENAWDRAVAIANGRTDTERDRVMDRIEEHATVVARLIAAPTVPLWTLRAMQHLERSRDWTRYLAGTA